LHSATTSSLLPCTYQFTSYRILKVATSTILRSHNDAVMVRPEQVNETRHCPCYRHLWQHYRSWTCSHFALASRNSGTSVAGDGCLRRLRFYTSRFFMQPRLLRARLCVAYGWVASVYKPQNAQAPQAQVCGLQTASGTLDPRTGDTT